MEKKVSKNYQVHYSRINWNGYRRFVHVASRDGG